MRGDAVFGFPVSRQSHETRLGWEMAANPDLWQKLLELEDRHEVKWEWVRGHAGNKGNECCDRLSAQAARRNNLGADEEFEQEPVGTNLAASRPVASSSDAFVPAH